MYKIQLDYIVVIFNWMVRRGAKVSAPLVFAEGKEYNERRSFGGSVKSL
jgi:hypothetical protein